MSRDPLLGTHIGPYRLISLLGVGGMSRVYAGEHVYLGRQAAIKVLSSTLVKDPQSLSRFCHEARAAAEARSPYIVEIYDFIWDAKTRHAAYVMELLHGRDLRTILQARHRLPAQTSARIALDVCRALAVLHGRGVIHRDIKPENVFVCENSGGVKLIDLGVAKFGSRAVSHKTLLGAPVGSPWYMSPEQAAAQELDGRADLYALGVVMFEMLCGQVPFSAATSAEVCRMHLEQAPARLPGSLGAIIARCLSKSPADRYPDAAALEGALVGEIETGVQVAA